MAILRVYIFWGQNMGGELLHVIEDLAQRAAKARDASRWGGWDGRWSDSVGCVGWLGVLGVLVGRVGWGKDDFWPHIASFFEKPVKQGPNCKRFCEDKFDP